MPQTHNSTVSEAEVAQFDALAARWWDPSGPMRPLHQMNPARVGWIDRRIRRQLAGADSLPPILDIGCGAGLLTEALARRGYQVLGLDPAAEAINVATAHAEAGGLRVTYRVGQAEDLVIEGQTFPVVTALEMIEHVPEPNHLLTLLARLVTPGGLLFVSTLNRTLLSYLTAKLGAEYVLRWLPVGTHDWRKFIAPAELGSGLRAAGLHLADIAGMQPDLWHGGWRTGGSLAVNYIAMARKLAG